MTINAAVDELLVIPNDVPTTVPVANVCSSLTTELPDLSQLPKTVPTFLLSSAALVNT